MISTLKYCSPLGGILLAADEDGLTELRFCRGTDNFPAEHTEAQTPVLADAVRWLDIYFGGKEPDFIPPLHPAGSRFRMEVWEILLRIPYGKTVTYGEIAGQLAGKDGN